MTRYESSYGAQRAELRQRSSRDGEAAMPMPVPAVSMLGVSMRATRWSDRGSEYTRPRESERQAGRRRGSGEASWTSAADKGTRGDARSRSTRKDLVALRGGLYQDPSDDGADDAVRGGRSRRYATSSRAASLRIADDRGSREDLRHGAGRDESEQEDARDRIQARPAVYTADASADGRGSRSHAGDETATTWRDALSERVSGLSLPSLPLLLIVGLVLALTVVIVAGPVRTYYAAWRDEGILDAQYEVVAAQYEELSGEVERLQTIEGVEEAARERGYVYPDEEALVVTGLEEDEPSEAALIEEAVAQHEANQPWYVHVLDSIFGYEPAQH